MVSDTFSIVVWDALTEGPITIPYRVAPCGGASQICFGYSR